MRMRVTWSLPNRQSAELLARPVRRVPLLKPPPPIGLSGLSRPVVSARTVVIVRCFQRTNADSGFCSPIGVRGESRTLPADNVSLAPLQPLRLMSVNIRDVVRHMAELQIRLQEHKPNILVVQETWLDESTPRVTIPGFTLVSRLDRARGPKASYGGVALFASNPNLVSHLQDSTSAERSWHTVHTDIGPILLGNWYRAPDAGPEPIASLATELEGFGDQFVGTIILGDMNVHHARCLAALKRQHRIGRTIETSLRRLWSSPVRWQTYER